MKKKTMKYIGSMQQLAFVRPVEYREGRAAGLKAYDIKNEDIRFTVLADKCLDVADFSYKGMNLNFLSKPGLQGRNHYDTNGKEALRSIMGGMFFTCGLENICAPCSIEGKDYPMHGRIRTTPAEQLSARADWESDEYILSVEGQMREAELFGENLVLNRKISTVYGERSILVEDHIENQSFRNEPMMLLYHCNIGYPMLDESVRIYLPTDEVKARDQVSEAHITDWGRMEPPKDNEQEYVYSHELRADRNNNTMALIVNEDKEIGICYEFNKQQLPYFMEWKSLASGDYVVGFEPSNSSVYGRMFHEKKGTVPTLEPFEKRSVYLKISILEGQAEILNYKKQIEQLGKGEEDETIRS